MQWGFGITIIFSSLQEGKGLFRLKEKELLVEGTLKEQRKLKRGQAENFLAGRATDQGKTRVKGNKSDEMVQQTAKRGISEC